MTFDDLALFWALAERQNMTEAAKAADISQPTASRRLQAMEQELGAQLVDRETHPLSLTPFGFLFLDFADDVLKRYRALLLQADQRHSIIGRLTLATSSSPAARLVTRWMADFIAANPGVNLHLWEMNSHEVERRIVNGDVVIGFTGLTARHPEVTAIPIADDEIVLLVPAALMHGVSRSVQWDELRRLPFVVRRSGSGTQDVVDAALQAGGFALPSHVVLEVDSAAALIDAVESGLGAGFVSRELLFRRELRLSTPIAVKDLSIHRPFFLAYHAERVSQYPIAYQFLRYASWRLAQRDKTVPRP